MSRRQGFTELTAEKFGRTLGQKLLNTVDRIRDINTKLGLRPFVVKIVRVRWTGGYRGEGAQVVVQEDTLLPTPRVQDIAGLRDVMEPIGREEVGELLVSEISGRYSENFLRGLDAEGNPPSEDEAIYWTIEYVGQNRGGKATVRWFQPASAPGFRPDRFEWKISLMRAENAGLGEVL